MRFQEPLRMVEAARAELERARSNSEVEVVPGLVEFEWRSPA